MTKTDTTPVHPILVAIDIAKHRNEVLIAEPGRKRRRRMTIRKHQGRSRAARNDAHRL